MYCSGGISANPTIMAKIEESYQKIINDYQVLSKVQMPKVLPCKLANDAGVIGAIKQILDSNREKGET